MKLQLGPDFALPPEAVDDLLRRFWLYVEPEPNSGCWLWIGANVKGYGVLSLGAPSRRKILVTRLSYIAFVGPLADGEKACHRCDFPPCCNPAHLFKGTQTANMRDAANKGRLAGRAVGRGERHYRARLTADTVLQIRARYAAGENATILAAEFAVTLQGIMAVVHRKTWRHVA